MGLVGMLLPTEGAEHPFAQKVLPTEGAESITSRVAISFSTCVGWFSVPKTGAPEGRFPHFWRSNFGTSQMTIIDAIDLVRPPVDHVKDRHLVFDVCWVVFRAENRRSRGSLSTLLAQ